MTVMPEMSYRWLFETAKDGILILDAVTGEIDDVDSLCIDAASPMASKSVRRATVACS